jgi:hypothetical protein
MPILWQTIAWFGNFAAALLMATWMRILGFGWPAIIIGTMATFMILPFVIGQRYATVLTRRKRDPHNYLKCFQSLPADALQILANYSELHTDFAGCVIDTSWLPADKEKMKNVLKLSWLRANSDEARNWVETGWVLLSWFQDGVGRIPINVAAKTSAKLPIEWRIDYGKEKSRWLNLVFAESDALGREFDQFKQVVALKARS